MRYYISDCHFFHGMLNDHMDHRGFSDTEEMNDYMIRQWNAKVKRGDEVVILGDFSYGSGKETGELLERLNGILYLIRGNHDRFLDYRQFDSSRFVWVRSYEEMHDRKRKVILSHYPIFCYNGQYRIDEKGEAQVYMLYGHVHNTKDEALIRSFQETTRACEITDYHGNVRKIPCNMINCFCGFSDYTPLTLDEWIENDKKRRNFFLTNC